MQASCTSHSVQQVTLIDMLLPVLDTVLLQAKDDFGCLCAFSLSI